MARAILGIDVFDTIGLCPIPETPDSILGPLMGQCDQSGVSYSIYPVTGATSYSWYLSDEDYASIVGPANLSGITVDFSDSLHFVSLYVSANNACGSSYYDTLTVYGGPTIPASISGNTSVCASSVESYSTSGASGAMSYIWTIPSGATILGPTSGSSIIIFWGSTGGDITVAALNSCDTSTIRTQTVSITCRKGSSALVDYKIETFPNPTTGFFTLRFLTKETVPYFIKIADATGRILVYLPEKASLGINSKELDLSTMPKGVYYLNVIFDERSEIIKIIIQ